MENKTQDKQLILSVSTDPVPSFTNILTYLKELQTYNVDFIHCDVMDGIFVSRATFNHEYIKALNDNLMIPLDVHLMIDSPWLNIKEYIDAGANILTVHYESFYSHKMLANTLKRIKEAGVLVGLAINPSTEASLIVDVLYLVDILLVMSVEPGVSGQEFLPETYTKLKQINVLKDKFNFKFKIEVDGGINPEIALKLKKLGVEMIVSGSYVFNSERRKLDIRKIKC